MKNTKKFASIATAALLAACTVVPSMASLPAWAAGNNTITIEGFNTSTSNDDGTHTYEAYQVFSGDYSDGVLSNIQWGSGVNQEGLLDAVKAITLSTGIIVEQGGLATTTPFANVESAADVANILSGYYATGEATDITAFADDAEIAQAFADVIGTHLRTATGTSSGGSISGLDDGYYLVQDTSDSPSSTVGEDNSGAKTRFILKVVGGTTVTVQAKSSAPSVVKKVKENTDVSDYEDPSSTTWADYNDVADYNIGDEVPFLLVGTLPSTLNDYSKYKYVFHDTLDSQFTITDDTTVTVKIDGTDKTESATITKTPGTNTITVQFDDIIAAGATADSVVTVEYSAVLNENAEIGLPGQENEVYLTYSNNPNWSGTGTPDDNGQTPVDKVIVFTYELDVTKYLGDKSETANATSGTQAGFKLYSQAKAQWATVNTTGGVNKITGWTSNKKYGTEVKTNGDGKFSFVGLDDGQYTLSETTTPSGYNTMADLTITIDADTSNTQTWTETPSDALTEIKLTGMGTSDITGDTTSGIVAGEIINQKGSTLPSTGGIGTTIFYIGGGVLVVGAGVLLITKKRAKSAEEA